MKSKIAYRKARSSDMDRVRELIREYAGSIGVDIEYQGLSEELAGLPGKYAEPRGAIIVAEQEDLVVGIVALRDLGGGACEMKRLFVTNSARGMGIGRALVDRIVSEGAEKGYRAMRLDTLRSMESALGLYRAAGFRERDPYIYNPLPGAVYMEKTL
jgi:ribosomal protein S18 acetylase RimI-like enzyme